MPQLKKDQTAMLASVLAACAAQNDSPRPIAVPCTDYTVAQVAAAALGHNPPFGLGLAAVPDGLGNVILGDRNNGFTWGA